MMTRFSAIEDLLPVSTQWLQSDALFVVFQFEMEDKILVSQPMGFGALLLA